MDGINPMLTNKTIVPVTITIPINMIPLFTSDLNPANQIETAGKYEATRLAITAITLMIISGEKLIGSISSILLLVFQELKRKTNHAISLKINGWLEANKRQIFGFLPNIIPDLGVYCK